MFLFKALSLLPLPVLYLLSDVLYFFARYIFRYRRKVIDENLKNSFPDKTEKELEKIAGAFYRNLTDLIAETIKVLSLSEEDLKARVRPVNTLPVKYLAAGKSVIVLAGHLCNWEWLLSSCMVHYKYPIDAVYKPLNSRFSDKLMFRIRSKFGASPLAMKDVLRDQVKKKNATHGLAMVADQTPQKNEIQFWTTFLHQDTPFFVGGDKIARMLNMPVFFAGMRRVGRGRYEMYFKEISLPPHPEKEFIIIEKYAQVLEEEIRQQPANWLWSHRKWKHKRD